jgi:phage shock protein PspC (stress-responsive transcriptional regulator)
MSNRTIAGVWQGAGNRLGIVATGIIIHTIG